MSDKNALIAVGAFVVGVGVGFFAGKYLYKRYYEDVAKDEIDTAREIITRIERKKKENKLKTLRRLEEKEDYRTNSPMSRSSLDATPYEQTKRNYGLVRNDIDRELDEELEGETLDSLVNEPYLITDDEFLEGDHENISLVYYQEENILCDELTNEVIDDPDDVIGTEAMTVLEMGSNAWVRNDGLGIDYEIICLRDAVYEPTVFEKKEEPKKPKPRNRLGRREKNKNDE